jgi:hypothetical protein
MDSSEAALADPGAGPAAVAAGEQSAAAAALPPAATRSRAASNSAMRASLESFGFKQPDFAGTARKRQPRKPKNAGASDRAASPSEAATSVSGPSPAALSAAATESSEADASGTAAPTAKAKDAKKSKPRGQIQAKPQEKGIRAKHEAQQKTAKQYIDDLAAEGIDMSFVRPSHTNDRVYCEPCEASYQLHLSILRQHFKCEKHTQNLTKRRSRDLRQQELKEVLGKMGKGVFGATLEPRKQQFRVTMIRAALSVQVAPYKLRGEFKEAIEYFSGSDLGGVNHYSEYLPIIQRMEYESLTEVHIRMHARSLAFHSMHDVCALRLLQSIWPHSLYKHNIYVIVLNAITDIYIYLLCIIYI